MANDQAKTNAKPLSKSENVEGNPRDDSKKEDVKDKEFEDLKARHDTEIASYGILSTVTSPHLTIYYTFHALLVGIPFALSVIWNNLRRIIPISFAVAAIFALIAYGDELLEKDYPLVASIIERLREHSEEFLWWLMLGIASSIGLGSGLHTFVLFLGPYVAQYTRAVYQCNTVDVIKADDGRFHCPVDMRPGLPAPTVFEIWWGIKFAAFTWGFGTALGELPPYVMAAWAAKAGDVDETISEINRLQKEHPGSLSWSDYLKMRIYWLVQNHGFIAILLLASIPNPLFDLAGIVCGYFLIPWPIFFTAVSLGKGFFKVSLQTLSIVLMFSDSYYKAALSFLQSQLPEKWYSIVFTFLEKQHSRFAREGGSEEIAGEVEETNPLSLIMQWFVTLAIAFFFLSILQGVAQSGLRAKQARELENLKKAKESNMKDD